MRKRELLVNLVVHLGPFVIALGAVWAVGVVYAMPETSVWSMLALFTLGFLSFAMAKISVIKQGHLVTFGPARMSMGNRVAYYLGYGGMLFGLFLLLALLATMR